MLSAAVSIENICHSSPDDAWIYNKLAKTKQLDIPALSLSRFEIHWENPKWGWDEMKVSTCVECETFNNI